MAGSEPHARTLTLRGWLGYVCLLLLSQTSAQQPSSADRFRGGARRPPPTNGANGTVAGKSADSAHRMLDDGFFRRSETTLDGLHTIAQALHHAQQKGQLRLAILGGSVSAGGGCRSGCAVSPKVMSECGLCWPDVLRDHMRSLGLHVKIVNGARGSTGPDFAYLCADMLLQQQNATRYTVHAYNWKFDLAILEFAINAGRGPDCTKIGPTMEALLSRAQAMARSVIFLNTFSRNVYMDAAMCFDILARHRSIPSLSWKDALWPLIRDGRVEPASVFQVPLLHHPNVEGHRQIGMIVARLLEKVNATSMRKPAPMVEKDPLPVYGEGGKGVHNASLPFGQCVEPAKFKPAASHGWAMKLGHPWWSASAENASLSVPFVCEQAGCGLIVLLTQSYQPLGMLDIYVDGELRHQKVSAAARSWALTQNPKWTVQRIFKVVDPGPSKGLRAGSHALVVVCRGETDPALAAVPFLGNTYVPNEVHIRGFVIIYEE